MEKGGQRVFLLLLLCSPKGGRDRASRDFFPPFFSVRSLHFRPLLPLPPPPSPFGAHFVTPLRPPGGKSRMRTAYVYLRSTSFTPKVKGGEPMVSANFVFLLLANLYCTYWTQLFEHFSALQVFLILPSARAVRQKTFYNSAYTFSPLLFYTVLPPLPSSSFSSPYPEDTSSRLKKKRRRRNPLRQQPPSSVLRPPPSVSSEVASASASKEEEGGTGERRRRRRRRERQSKSGGGGRRGRRRRRRRLRRRRRREGRRLLLFSEKEEEGLEGGLWKVSLAAGWSRGEGEE